MKLLFNLLLFIVFFSCNLFSQLLEKDIKFLPGFDTLHYPFYFGVASGDADTNSCVLWTKIVPKIHYRSIDVYWEVAIDTNFKNIVKKGRFRTNRSMHYVVKFIVSGLFSNRRYFYRFKVWKFVSDIGRLKTLPSTSDTVKQIKFISFTGSNYSKGYFNVYKEIAKHQDVDFLIHNGDYIYEYASDNDDFRKIVPAGELINQRDYDLRYALYRLDKDLQNLHRLFTWYLIWDDHEFANNAWKDGAFNHQTKTEGEWQKRKQIAKTVYFRWMPITDNKKMDIYRSFQVGKLAKFLFLDTRIEGRSKQTLPLEDTNKKIMSDTQWQWLFSQLNQSDCHWNIIVQQVMFAPLLFRGKILNNDQWDGYPYEREKLLAFLYKNRIKNTLIISGDFHSSMANEIYYNDSIIAVELLSPSITSTAKDGIIGILAEKILRFYNRDIRFIEIRHRGFLMVKITPQRIWSTWYLINHTNEKRYKIIKIKKMYVNKPYLKLHKSK